MNLFLGNFFMFLASMIMVSLGFVKDKKKIIFFQTIQIALIGIGDIILGSIPGFIISLFACTRNVLVYKNKLNRIGKIVLSTLSVTSSLLFNNIGLMGFLPAVVSAIYVWCIDTKDITKFKLLEIFSNSCWFMHDFYIKAYIIVIFDALSVCSNLFTFLKLKLKKKDN